MGKTRLEAFSDGVLAIIITIMGLQMKVPHGATPAALVALLLVFLSDVLSFVCVGIYRNNHHHHLLRTCSRVTGPILWAKLHLRFWLSLFPCATGWMEENHFIGADWKGKVSPMIDLVGIGLTFVSAWLVQALYVLVARVCRVLGRRIERARHRAESTFSPGRTASPVRAAGCRPCARGRVRCEPGSGAAVCCWPP